MRTITLNPGALANPLSDLAEKLGDLFSPIILAITTAMATSFKSELMTATHNFSVGGNNFRLALFDGTATMDSTTTTYTGTNEVVGSGYTAGGQLLTNVAPTTSGTTAFTTFNSPLTWTAATFTAAGCQIYNSTNGNRSVGVFSFGSNIPVVSGNFTLSFPTANATAAVLRIQ